MNEIVMLFLEKICEAIYFSLFLILGKNLQKKRVLFTFIMISEYLLLKQVFSYNIWFQVIYTFMSFVNLKVLYKEKAQITDIFLFSAASIILIIIGILCVLPKIIFGIDYNILLIINRIVMFLILFLLKNKIYVIYKKIFLNWNRKPNSKIKSLTLRNISIIAFNISFFILNGMLIYLSIIGKRGV